MMVITHWYLPSLSTSKRQYLLAHGRGPPLAELGLLGLDFGDTLVEEFGVFGLFRWNQYNDLDDMSLK